MSERLGQTLNREKAALLSSIPLLQSGEIKTSREIKDGEDLDPKLLFKMWDFARNYVTPHNFIAVAFTQFYSSTLLDYVGRDDLIRVIYFDNHPILDMRVRDSLLINPRVGRSSEGFYVRVEGCGSIEHANLAMAVKRPMSVGINGLVWNPPMQKPLFEPNVFSGETASIALHEIKHLEGQDATDHKEDILDFSDETDWGNTYDKRQVDVYSTIRNQDLYREWLVNRNDKLIVVNQYGKYKRDYAKPGK